MYPHDNIFNIYYNIGKRTPFLVKRCEVGLERSSSEERRIDPNRDRTFLVETVKPKGKYGKAYGKCFVDGKPDDTYRQECYPNIKDDEIPCAGCGEWVLIDVPGVSLDKIFPIHKANDILAFGKYKGKSFGEIYKTDNQYLHWLETTDRFFKIDFDELKQLYPEVKESLDIPIFERKIDFFIILFLLLIFSVFFSKNALQNSSSVFPSFLDTSRNHSRIFLIKRFLISLFGIDKRYLPLSVRPCCVR